MKIQFTHKHKKCFLQFVQSKLSILTILILFIINKEIKITYDYLCHRKESFIFFNFSIFKISIFTHKYFIEENFLLSSSSLNTNLTLISVTNDSSEISTYHFSNYSQDSYIATQRKEIYFGFET